MKKSFSRGTALVAGTAMLLINGVVYAWSIYSSPFVEGFGWSSAKLGVCFTVMLGSFCLGGVIGGAVANWKANLGRRCYCTMFQTSCQSVFY